MRMLLQQYGSLALTRRLVELEANRATIRPSLVLYLQSKHTAEKIPVERIGTTWGSNNRLEVGHVMVFLRLNAPSPPLWKIAPHPTAALATTESQSIAWE